MQNEETDEIPFVVVVDISLASSSRTTERVPTKAQVHFSRRLPSSLLCYKLPIENQTNNARRIKDFRIDVTLPARSPTGFVNWVGKVGVYPSPVEKGESRRK